MILTLTYQSSALKCKHRRIWTEPPDESLPRSCAQTIDSLDSCFPRCELCKGNSPDGSPQDLGRRRTTLWLDCRHSLYSRQWYLRDTWRRHNVRQNETERQWLFNMQWCSYEKMPVLTAHVGFSVFVAWALLAVLRQKCTHWGFLSDCGLRPDMFNSPQTIFTKLQHFIQKTSWSGWEMLLPYFRGLRVFDSGQTIIRRKEGQEEDIPSLVKQHMQRLKMWS